MASIHRPGRVEDAVLAASVAVSSKLLYVVSKSPIRAMSKTTNLESHGGKPLRVFSAFVCAPCQPSTPERKPRPHRSCIGYGGKSGHCRSVILPDAGTCWEAKNTRGLAGLEPVTTELSLQDTLHAQSRLGKTQLAQTISSVLKLWRNPNHHRQTTERGVDDAQPPAGTGP